MGKDGAKALKIVSDKNGKTVVGVKNNSMTEIEIPSDVTGIGYEAFAWCGKLNNIEIPNGVTSIGDMAFKGCDGLTKVTIPNGVTRIGKGIFYNCAKLAEVRLPSGVVDIGYGAFFNCVGLKSVQFGGTVAQWNGVIKDPSWKINSKIGSVVCADGTVEA